MNEQPTHETDAPASSSPYVAPQRPMSKKELKAQKRMQKASRGWFARHKVLTGVLVLGGVVAVASQLGGEDEPADASASSAATGGTGEPAAAEPAGSQVGVPVPVGDLEITVDEVETGVPSVGDEFLGEEAQGQFVLVDVTISNTGDSGETFWESDAVLVDTEGREHSTSSASMYLEDGNWLLTEINPGNTTNGTLLFDIPADAEPDLLQVSAGVFSGDEEIRLR